MTVVTDKAIVLRRVEYSETSQIVELFTRSHGRLRAIAKGIKRSTRTRFSPGIDLLDHGQVTVRSRQERPGGLATLTEWKQLPGFSGIRDRLASLHAAQYAAEVTGRSTEEWDPHPELFDALGAALGRFAAGANLLGALAAYQFELLAAIGSLPRFDACVLCGRWEDLTHFSSIEGGAVCRSCEPAQVEKHAISLETLHVCAGWTAGLAHRPGQVVGAGTSNTPCIQDWSSIGGSFALLNYHIAHVIGREPLLACKIMPLAGRPVSQ